MSVFGWQMQSLSCVPHQGNGSSGPRPVCTGDPGPLHRPHFIAGAPTTDRTQHPTQPYPRDSAAGLQPHMSHKPVLPVCTTYAMAINCGWNHFPPKIPQECHGILLDCMLYFDMN